MPRALKRSRALRRVEPSIRPTTTLRAEWPGTLRWADRDPLFQSDREPAADVVEAP